ncbi:MAG: 16S rRNA (adenine(1518)-N(6)/adenine(1519)-N(6))-dimethyltransferase RsmA [Candidatus Taylorbacteria bacterium]
MRLFAKKSLGQHFLNSTHVLEQIIQASELDEGELVLEIGPGTGVLTTALLKTGARVIAIEKDVRAKEVLQERFAQELKTGQLELIEGDVLNDQLPLMSKKSETYSIVANIPYYITGAILEKFLEHAPRPTKMVLLVQKEVAERIIARDGKESILSISVKAFGTPTLVAKVPPGAFTPPPTVDSAILKIDSITDNLFAQNNVDIQAFFKIVKAGFAHKRKYARRNLESIYPLEIIDSVWAKTTLDPQIRPEDMTVLNWITLAQHLL